MSTMVFFKDFSFYTVINIIRYLLLTGLAYRVFWKYGAEKFSHKKIPTRVKRKETPPTLVKLEIRQSLITMLMVALILTIMKLMSEHHLNQIYYQISDFGWGYFLLSIPLMILIHDAYFYFLHRTLHHPKLYRKFHIIHHLSVNPTPFAAYSFHPLEGFLSSAILLVISVVIPVHINAFIIFSVIWTVVNINGHLGYELFSGRKNKWINNSTAHHLHHQGVNGNFGLYFTFWDKWLKTWRD